MRALRPGLLAVGVVAVLGGLVWMGQGSGFFRYPASSFMIDQTSWIYRGAAMAVFGALIIAVSRRV